MKSTNHIDAPALADLLDQSNVLSIINHGTSRMYVLEFDKQDILVFADPNNEASVVYPPESFDAESGGSIHDHARAILCDTINDDFLGNGTTCTA